MAPVAPNPKEEDWKTTKSQTDNTESQDFNSIYVRFVKETDLIKKFNIFLELHCKKDYAHLIDSDDNAGEYMREAIQAKLQEQDIKSRIDELENIVKKAEIKGASFTFEYKYFADRLTELRSKL